MHVITREDIASEVAKRMNLTRRDTRAVLNTIVDVIHDNLCDGNHVRLNGFGTFELRSSKRRLGCNVDIKTGTMLNLVEIPPHRRVWFRVCRGLRLEIVKLPLAEAA